MISAGVHVGAEGGELVDKLFAQGGLEVIAIDHVLQPVGGGKVSGLFAAWGALFVGAAEGGKNVAGDFFFRYVHIDQRDLHVGGALGMAEGVFNELNAGVVFAQFLHKHFSPVGVGIADGFRVQQTHDLAAALHEGEGVQKVFVAAVERRIHDAEVVLLEAAEGEKIVVDHVQPLAAQEGGKVAVALDAVYVGIVLVEGDTAAVPVAADESGNGIGKVAFTGGGFEDRKNTFPVHAGEHFPRQLGGRGVKAAVVEGRQAAEIGGAAVRCGGGHGGAVFAVPVADLLFRSRDGGDAAQVVAAVVASGGGADDVLIFAVVGAGLDGGDLGAVGGNGDVFISITVFLGGVGKHGRWPPCRFLVWCSGGEGVALGDERGQLGGVDGAAVLFNTVVRRLTDALSLFGVEVRRGGAEGGSGGEELLALLLRGRGVGLDPCGHGGSLLRHVRRWGAVR